MGTDADRREEARMEEIDERLDRRGVTCEDCGRRWVPGGGCCPDCGGAIIGWEAGAKRVEGGGAGSGRGSGHRVFGAAQQIIAPLNGLRKRGLIESWQRDDGLSGGAYRLTDEGRRTGGES